MKRKDLKYIMFLIVIPPRLCVFDCSPVGNSLIIVVHSFCSFDVPSGLRGTSFIITKLVGKLRRVDRTIYNLCVVLCIYCMSL